MLFDLIWLVASTLVGWFSVGLLVALLLKSFSKKLYRDFVGDNVKLRHLFTSGILVIAMLSAIIKTYPF